MHGSTMKIIKLCFKMLCIYTTLYTLVFVSSFLHLRPLLHHPSPFHLYIHELSPSHVFLESYDVIILTNSFLHLYIHIFSLSHVFSERYDVIIVANAFLFSFIYSSIIYFTYIFRFFFSVALRPNAGHGLLILEVF